MAEKASSCRKRNIEGKLNLRREISRSAARDRRSLETNVLDELLEEIPLVTEPKVTLIDRIAQLRLAATFVRLRGCVPKLMETVVSDCDEDGFLWSEETIANSLDGFVFICSGDGIILYVTESVSIFIGLTQTDLVGRMLKDFLNGDDYSELRQIMTEQNALNSDGRLIVMRIKSVISPRGRKLKPKAAFMKPMMFCLRSLDNGAKGRINLLQAVTAPAVQAHLCTEISKRDTENGTFSSRHTCDMKFTYVDESIYYCLKLTSKALLGTSFFDLVYPEDLLELVKSFKVLFKKTYCRTPYYRLVGATGAVSWMQTEASTVSNITRGQRGQYVICVHQLLGTQSGSESSAFGAENGYPAATTVQVKTEVDDSLDYLGFEPNMIECVDFIPLVDEKTYHKKTPTMTRKDSFDELLQWLVGDIPYNPPQSTILLSDAFNLDSSNSTAFVKCYQKEQRCDSPIFVESGTQCSPCPMETDATEFALLAESSDSNNSNISPMQLETCDSSENLSTTNRVNADIAFTEQESSNIPNADMVFGDVHELLETLAPFVAQEEMMPLAVHGLLSDINYDTFFESEINMLPVDSSLTLPTNAANKVFTDGTVTESEIFEELLPSFNLDTWFKAQKIMEMDDALMSTPVNLGSGSPLLSNEKFCSTNEQFGQRQQLSLNTDELLTSKQNSISDIHLRPDHQLKEQQELSGQTNTEFSLPTIDLGHSVGNAMVLTDQFRYANSNSKQQWNAKGITPSTSQPNFDIGFNI